MTLNKEVTIGNLVSWGMIVVAFVSGYVTLRGDTTHALQVANEAKETATAASIQINSLKTDIAVIKVTTQNTEMKIEEIRSYLANKTQQLR